MSDAKFYDVFNGDADGICALHQLRLAHPRPEAELVTGVKRDVKLLKRIGSPNVNTEITVLDVSMESNMEALNDLLSKGCRVTYIDHHFVDKIPETPNLKAHIDPSPSVCTSLIVDQLLQSAYRAWAVAGAFGDNLHESAVRAAESLSLNESDIGTLREIGELLNYNGYGPTTDDLHFHPKDLYLSVSRYDDPFAFFKESDVLGRLKTGYADDMSKACRAKPHRESASGRIYILPGEPWARRVSGVFSNEKAREQPNLANALLIENEDGTYRISVRAPLADRSGADELCLAFPTGGGRKAAAGVNALPPDMLDQFMDAFDRVFDN